MKVAARGLSFDVHVSGPVGGVPVLLLHGFPQHAGMWDQVAPVLHAGGYQTVAPDQRGYSPGARPADVTGYRLAEATADALAIADALELATPHVVGHDWGSLVGWHLASGYPDRIRTLTAVSIPHPLALADALAEDADQRGRSAYIQLFRIAGKAEEVLVRDDAARLRTMFAGCPPRRIDSYVEPLREPGALTGALNWYRALSRADNEDLRPVSVPTTFVWGDRDIAIGPTAAKRCGRYVTGDYRFEPLVGVSHWVPDEAPGELAEAIMTRISTVV
jgi:pimeloyl-ACP methyl ester carboxylesterase